MIRAREQLEEFERYITDIILDRRAGPGAEVWRVILRGLSLLYGGIVRCRLRAFEKRIFRAHTLGVMVVSVGNLTVGGTGKTPVVEMLSKALAAGGRRVAVLSRGYKSKQPPLLRRLRDGLRRRKKRQWPRVVSDGKSLLLDSRMAGDEPYMLAKNLRGAAAVLVDKDRVRSGAYAIRHLGADTLVLDDGFQFLRLKHRVNVVLVDSTAPFGNRHMLPRGILREPPSSLRRADWIFLTKCRDGRMGGLAEEIRRRNPSAGLILCRHKPLHLRNLVDESIEPLESLRGLRVGALSAIARPESFEQALEEQGAEVVIRTHFEDHHRYSLRDIKGFLDRCSRRDLDACVTTEKDAVKFPPLADPPVPVFFLRMEIEILGGQESWHEFLDLMCGRRPFKPQPKLY